MNICLVKLKILTGISNMILKIYFCFLHMHVLPACTYVHACMPAAHRGQKRVLIALVLDLQKMVSCHVCSGNQT